MNFGPIRQRPLFAGGLFRLCRRKEHSFQFRVPELLDIAKTSLWTDIPVEQLPDLFEIAARVKPGSIAQYQFWPPEINEYLDIPSINKIRLMVRTAFTGPVPTPDPSSSPTPAPGSGSIC